MPSLQDKTFNLPQLTFAVVAVVGVLLVPLFLRGFFLFQLSMILVYALAILALNLLSGYSGQFSLGQSAFFALGGYTVAMLMNHQDMAYYFALPIAGGVALIAGLLIGLPAVKLEGIYLAMATFALSIAAPQLANFTPFSKWTGGPSGLSVVKPDAPFGLPMSSDQWMYLMVAVAFLLALAFSYSLLKSRSGRAMIALRDNPIAASSMGVNLSYYKVMSFGLSAMLTGLAGGFAVLLIEFIAPDSFNVLLSIALLVGLVVGGVSWLPGAVIGGAFILLVPNLAEGFSKGLAGIIYGAVIIVLVLFMPGGFGSLVSALCKKRPNKRELPQAIAPPLFNGDKHVNS